MTEVAGGGEVGETDRPHRRRRAPAGPDQTRWGGYPPPGGEAGRPTS